MKLLIAQGKVFFPVGEHYLLYICTEDSLKYMTLTDIRQLIQMSIEEARGEMSVTVH